jgi:telomerase reverse transcriptase
VDFAIWVLFHRIHRHVAKPSHLLCHGYQRAHAPRQVGEDHCAMANIPGIVSRYPNGHVSTFKNETWAQIFALLGRKGNQVMLDMILGSAIFVSVETGNQNYYQLCGRSYVGGLEAS